MAGGFVGEDGLEFLSAHRLMRKQEFRHGDEVLLIAREDVLAALVGRVDDELFCSLRQLTTQLLVGQTAVERRDLQVDDTSALRPFPDRSSAVRFQSRG